jgi:hypothetical protein
VTDLTFHMSEASARTSVERARTHLEAAAEEVVRQINGRAWIALGYGSWDDMREAEYRGAAVIVPRADRPELLAKLRAEGLSQRQVADTIGVSQGLVSREIRNSNFDNTEQPATRIDSLGRERPTTYAPRAQDVPPASDAVERPANSVPSVPTRDLGDVLEERMPGTRADLARTSLRARWSKDMASAADIDLLDPEQVRAVIEDTEASVAIGTLRRLAKWADRLEQAGRPGLRIVGGNE